MSSEKNKLSKREKILIEVSVSCVVVAAGCVIFTVYTNRKRLLDLPLVERASLLDLPLVERGVSVSDVVNSQVNIASKVVNCTERIGRGHPEYMILDETTGVVYKSQLEAAKALGVSATKISNHLQGQFEHVSGHVLRRVTPADMFDLAS